MRYTRFTLLVWDVARYIRTNRRSLVLRSRHKLISDLRLTASLRCLKTRLFGQCVPWVEPIRNTRWSSSGGCGSAPRPGIDRRNRLKKRSTTCSCWVAMAGSQLASTAFTLGTVAVLPFYALMVFAPKAKITKTAMSSSLPYTVLGLVYAYLLYLSWTPDTIRVMFASKYWLPELPGILKMFSSEMTLASAWIHLLVVDLYAARRVYHDGLENGIETRHSVALCLLVCPIGILIHTITKAMIKARAAENTQALTTPSQ